MGMQLDYKCLTPEDWARMQADDPITVMEWFYSDEPAFSLDKCWDVMDFLIGGDAVMGGTESEIETNYGFIRYLMPTEVQKIADRLSTTSFSALGPKFDADAFNRAELYPLGLGGGWDDDAVAEEHEGFQKLYPALVAFFQQAARNGDVVLIALN
jgi:Domain of unknown function (DUF1877)